MKISIVLYDINNPGGIINHTEQLGKGLKENGHEVSICYLKRSGKGNPRRFTSSKIREESVFGVTLDQEKGWEFSPEQQSFYGNERGKRLFIEKMNKSDLIIWTIPIPTIRKDNEGDADWTDIYEKIFKTQIAVIHDVNCEKSYPHIRFIAEKLKFVAVHPASFESLDFLGGERTLIYNPMDPEIEKIPLRYKSEGFVCPHNFKAWKKIPDVVGGIRYMKSKKFGERRTLAGDGIDRRYMTSTDKCKYIHEDGVTYWKAAIDNGMNWDGFLSNKETFELMSKTKFVLDPSLSKRHTDYGVLFNRVTIEAMKFGSIPVCRNSGVYKTEAIISPGENYIVMPDTNDPKQMGMFLDSLNEIEDSVLEKIAENNYQTFKKFDRKLIAKQYVDFALGQATTPVRTSPLTQPTEKARKNMEFFRGATNNV